MNANIWGHRRPTHHVCAQAHAPVLCVECMLLHVVTNAFVVYQRGLELCQATPSSINMHYCTHKQMEWQTTLPQPGPAYLDPGWRQHGRWWRGGTHHACWESAQTPRCEGPQTAEPKKKPLNQCGSYNRTPPPPALKDQMWHKGCAVTSRHAATRHVVDGVGAHIVSPSTEQFMYVYSSTFAPNLARQRNPPSVPCDITSRSGDLLLLHLRVPLTVVQTHM